MGSVPFAEKILTRSVELAVFSTIALLSIRRRTGRFTKSLAKGIMATILLNLNNRHFLSCLKGITTKPNIGIKFMGSIIHNF